VRELNQCNTPKDDHVLAECSTEARLTRDTLAGYGHLVTGASMRNLSADGGNGSLDAKSYYTRVLPVARNEVGDA
jgi:hypothetical protein